MDSKMSDVQADAALARRTDVHVEGGRVWCNVCGDPVGSDDVCGDDCAQGELAKVLKHVRAKFVNAPPGSAAEAVFDELYNELLVGVHR